MEVIALPNGDVLNLSAVQYFKDNGKAIHCFFGEGHYYTIAARTGEDDWKLAMHRIRAYLQVRHIA